MADRVCNSEQESALRTRETFHIGLLGLGTVGTGVVRLLDQSRAQLRRRAGRSIEVRRAFIRDPGKPRDVLLPPERLVSDPDLILDDPEISVVVEVMGGIEPARRLILRALAAGKDVVTANKALLAEHGDEIFAAAREHGRALAFEASVGGGIPLIQAMTVGLAANQVHSIAAILNGTCNFILTSMTASGASYGDALNEAQSLGYAESDPTLDVNGTDTTHKLAILARLGFGAHVSTVDIPRRGIDRLDAADVRYAKELGYAVKLIALARRGDWGLMLRVAPTLVRHGTPLADVRGPYNAIQIIGDAVGDTLFSGRGAGAMPTASAVVADLIDVAVGRAAITSRVLADWSNAQSSPILASSTQVRSRYYLRFTIADRPGVLAALARSLGDHTISIASVIQHEVDESSRGESGVPLVIMTHMATEADILAALAEINRLDAVKAPAVCLGVLD